MALLFAWVPELIATLLLIPFHMFSWIWDLAFGCVSSSLLGGECF